MSLEVVEYFLLVCGIIYISNYLGSRLSRANSSNQIHGTEPIQPDWHGLDPRVGCWVNWSNERSFAPSSEQRLLKVFLVNDHVVVRVFGPLVQSSAGPIPCWSFVSDGLWILGQPEILCSIERDATESETAIPESLLSFYALMFDRAQRGEHAFCGDVIESVPISGLVPGEQSFSVNFLPPQLLSGVEFPSHAVTAVLLPTRESSLAKKYGHLRILARSGLRFGGFPSAVWLPRTAPHRSEAAAVEIQAESLLDAQPLQRMRGVSLLFDVHPPSAVKSTESTHEAQLSAASGFAGRLCLSIDPVLAAPQLALLSSPNEPVPIILETSLSPEADGLTVWPSKEGKPAFIRRGTDSPVRLGGNFLAIRPGQAADLVRANEDGFLLLVTDNTWSLCLAALREGLPFSIEAPDGELSFSLAWTAVRDHQRPRPSKAEIDAWWEPILSLPKQGAVAIERVEPVTPIGTLVQRLESAQCLELLRALQKQVSTFLLLDRIGTEILMNLLVIPDWPLLHDTSIPKYVPPDTEIDSDRAVMETILINHLFENGLAGPPIHGGPVAFRIHFEILQSHTHGTVSERPKWKSKTRRHHSVRNDPAIL